MMNCPTHKPVQHRDGKPPWCNACGYTAAVEAKPPAKVASPRNPRAA